MNEGSTNSFKIVVVGESGVGKTAIVNQLVSGVFHDECEPTIGIEFKSYTLQNDSEPIKLQIWDTAGQERFKSVSRAYFRNALGSILVFSIADRNTFECLDAWLNDLHSLCARNAHIILIGNKTDLEDDRAVPQTEAQEFAKRHDLYYLETSAKTGDNVKEAFSRLGLGILRKIQKRELTPVTPTPESSTAPLNSEMSPLPDTGCKC